ncbi:MAG: methylated-DNA--[protein]-cysteine S-methyltransferase, partial [Burkholderiales bacterium]
MNTLNLSSVIPDFRSSGTPAGPIQYAIGNCVIGKLLVARSAQGICAIFPGDDAQALRAQLMQAFPATTLEQADHALQPELAQIAVFIAAPARGLDMTLDVHGTPFQQRVWQALCEIPAGETASYADVARRIGAPGAVRAVGSACAANVLAVAIPCHRVVRANGLISGYR